MSEVFDVAILGLGVMGASAAWQLSKTSASVVGFEQFKIPHKLGSSHGKTRIIRQAYYEHPSYVPLLKRSYELWKKLEADSGEALLHIIGGLYFGPPDCELLVGTLESAEKHGLAVEMLSTTQLEARYPQLTFSKGDVGVFESSAGFVLAEESITAMLNVARKQGAELHEECPVITWSKTGATFSISTEKGQFKAKKLLICGGSYASELLPIKLPLKVSRQSVAWIQPDEPTLWNASSLPVTAFETQGQFLYTIPSQGDGPIKIAAHAIGREADPRTIDREWNPKDEETLNPAFQGPLFKLRGKVVETSICTYTNSPDSHFIIDYLSDPNVVIAAGFSGHGFKFAPLVGEICQQLILEGKSSHDIGLFSLERLKMLPQKLASPGQTDRRG